MTKQKNAEYDGEWVELLMTNWQGRAPLITGPNGSIDPMQGEISSRWHARWPSR